MQVLWRRHEDSLRADRCHVAAGSTTTLPLDLNARQRGPITRQAISFNCLSKRRSPTCKLHWPRGRLPPETSSPPISSRIAQYEDTLNAVININLNAYSEADDLDRERAQGRLRGPLHGIPIALKDNVNTSFMPTTGGALAFAGYTPPYDATVARNLRSAGAIVIAKTVMTELANWVSSNMPGNYSAYGGYGMNPSRSADPIRATPRMMADR